MVQLKVNFATSPRPDWRRLGTLFAVLGILSAGMIVAAGLLLAARRPDPRSAQIRQLAAQVRNLEGQVEDWRAAVERQKTRWQARVRLANQLIAAKTHSYCAVLDNLEELIPDGVQITSLLLTNGVRSPLTLRVAAASFDRLMELYKKLAPHGLVISDESETGAIMLASLQITLAP